ncbi:MAG: hypothetical protein D6729_16065 [Deltaproteobacteria bacterium]|nr:MAG: hypothetical protein D6729_16065 [Deltaproteobacteria bacterium]
MNRPHLLATAAWLGALAGGLLLAACATSQTPAPGAATAEAPKKAPAGPLAEAVDTVKPWEAMTKKEKAAYMKRVVLPRMATLLRSIDPEEFADVKCITCHGADAKEVGFEMPNGLHPLPADETLMEVARRENARLAEAMAKEVVPEMARLLGKAPYDPATGQGFGCFACHEVAKSEGPAASEASSVSGTSPAREGPPAAPSAGPRE